MPASIEEYPVIQNMARFYVYGMSEYLGDEEDWEMPEDGLYECIDLKKYWQMDNTFPFQPERIYRHIGFCSGCCRSSWYNRRCNCCLRSSLARGVTPSRFRY